LSNLSTKYLAEKLLIDFALNCGKSVGYFVKNLYSTELKQYVREMAVTKVNQKFSLQVTHFPAQFHNDFLKLDFKKNMF